MPRVITTPNTEELLPAAARNNAEWCAAVCRGGAFSADGWSSARRTPPLYPDAVTLTRHASAAALLAGTDTDSPGCSVKDSFADLDLGPAGFEVLFEARWIHRPAGVPVPAAPGLEWSRVRTVAELEAWETAWDGGECTGLFHPGLLTGDIALLAGSAGGVVVAGAVASVAAGVVGLSNVFTAEGTPADEAWRGGLTAVAQLWPDLPVVGYESGDDLDTAVRHGFTVLGPLRVWLHSSSRQDTA
ncbi:hypothetical protein AB0B01_00080 [Streptomyces sp. NPDC044571]|uniref:hypothetical protein n=1 Tax=Streptomyces sp. NPDC044571 TaxID=3155371 RepID=UPI0033D10D87